MDGNPELVGKHIDGDVKNNEDLEKPNDTGSQDDNSAVEESVTDDDEPGKSDLTTNKVAVDSDNKETVESDSNQSPEKGNVAVAIAENKNKTDESFDLDELSKITLGSNESDLSMESEDADQKHENNTASSAPCRTRSTRKRLPTGGYATLNSEKKTGEKKDKQKHMKKQIQEKNIILHLENDNKNLKEELKKLQRRKQPTIRTKRKPP